MAAENKSLATGTELQFTPEKHARALRAIGQDLAKLYPDRLEIEIDGNNFIARGRTGVRQQSDGKRKGLRRLWHRLSEPDSKATNHQFERTYTPDAIVKLGEVGRARRSGSIPKPDLYSIAEKLRMVGRIVDEKRAEFLKLCQDEQSVTFHYRDQHGKIHTEEYSHLALYKLQQQFFSGRSSSSNDSCRGQHRGQT